MTIAAHPEGIAHLEDRHPGTQHFGPLFAFGHLPVSLQAISSNLAGVAASVIRDTPDGPELTAGLRKLLEAKDCFVRAALAKQRA